MAFWGTFFAKTGSSAPKKFCIKNQNFKTLVFVFIEFYPV